MCMRHACLITTISKKYEHGTHIKQASTILRENDQDGPNFAHLVSGLTMCSYFMLEIIGCTYRANIWSKCMIWFT